MKRKSDGWNIVLAGFWNRMIFTPDWVIPRLFEGRESDVQMFVNLLPVLPVFYRDEKIANVQMEVSLARLLFRPLDVNDDQCLLRAQEMVRKVLIALPETPVQAVGINFAYKEEIPPGNVIAIFNDTDDVELSQQHWTIKERKLTKQLTRGGEVLNLTMTFDGKAVLFEFNFYSENGTNAQAALPAVEGRRILDLRDAARALLQEVYHLEPESEEEEED